LLRGAWPPGQALDGSPGWTITERHCGPQEQGVHVGSIA
jgi:hypothetical protein